MSQLANSVEASFPYVLRSTYQGTDTGLLWVPPSYRHRTVSNKGQAYSDSSERCGIRLGHFEVHNRSGGAASVGIGFRYAARFMGGGRLSADAATFTDLTSTFRSKGAATVQVTGADQTGFVVFSPLKFGWVSANFTTAETNAGGSTVADHTVAYWNGSAFTTITTTDAFKDDFTKTDAVWAAEEKNFVWEPAADWTKTTVGAIATIPADMYVMRFTSAHREATDVAAIVTGIEIGRGLFVDSLADNGIYENETLNYIEPAADGLIAFFGTASGQNRVYAEVESA